MGRSKDIFFELRSTEALDEEAIIRGREAVKNTAGEWQNLAIKRAKKLKNIEDKIAERFYYYRLSFYQNSKKQTSKTVEAWTAACSTSLEEVLKDAFGWTDSDIHDLDYKAHTESETPKED